MKFQKTYLGDGAYVWFDGYALWLTAENGIRATDTICLEPEVYNRLLAYVASIAAASAAHGEPSDVGRAETDAHADSPQGASGT